MPFALYKHSFPYEDARETTTGYSGPAMTTIENQRTTKPKDVIDSREIVRNSIEAIIGTSRGERVTI